MTIGNDERDLRKEFDKLKDEVIQIQKALKTIQAECYHDSIGSDYRCKTCGKLVEY
jgi:hypothetical protein